MKLIKQSLFLSLLLFISACCPHHYVPLEPGPLSSFYLPEKIRVALVLGGGGVKGIAHLGVLEELEKAGIKIDLIVGCSSGSIVGALYANNPSVDAIKGSTWQIRTDSLFDMDLWNCRYGLSQGKLLVYLLNKHLSKKTFEELQIPLVVVAADLKSGELVPIGSGDLITAVRASCSIPFVFVPCEHQGRILVDGGVINPVPVKVARDLGADIVIAVDLCELLEDELPSNLFGIAERCLKIALIWQNENCSKKADVIIRPKMQGVGIFNDKMKMEVYNAGKMATEKEVPKIFKLLSSQSKEYPLGQYRLVQPKCYSPITH